MIEAMSKAKVGDDVLGDDPTVIELEELAKKVTGKQGVLFICSGTMGNQISIRVHTNPGEEIIIEEDSHIFKYEVGGAAWNSLVQTRTIEGSYGCMSLEKISDSIRHDDIHDPRTGLICLENTHNNSGGVILPLEYIQEVRKLSQKRNIKMHLDGARIFNASAATGIPVKEYAKYFDSMMFCLSKGLCSPLGSILVGDIDFIDHARRVRKVLGGGWRQAGYLAACGIISIKKMSKRLGDDHAKARVFSKALGEMGEFSIDMKSVQTNMVYFKPLKEPAESFILRMKKKGVLALSHDDKVRFVFHNDVSLSDVKRALGIIKNDSMKRR
ncbi:MAG: GntG family PLP-dependent aldolase [bacterium]|nr:GntG family PLP-dependent aldolase [bacterium]